MTRATDAAQAHGKGKNGKATHHAKAHAEHDERSAREQARDDERYVDEHGDQLSASVRRAKWVHGPEDRPERDGQTLATRSLEVIRAWADARVLRFDFPGYDRELQPVSWEAWGDTFTSRDLVFLYQETLSSGRQSNFFRLDSPEREDG
mgnify:CR=1 FL=1